MLGAYRVWVPVLDQESRTPAVKAGKREPAFSAVLVELRHKQAGKVQNLDDIWHDFGTSGSSGSSALRQFIHENHKAPVPWEVKPSGKPPANFPGSTRQALEWQVTPQGSPIIGCWVYKVEVSAHVEVSGIVICFYVPLSAPARVQSRSPNAGVIAESEEEGCGESHPRPSHS